MPGRTEAMPPSRTTVRSPTKAAANPSGKKRLSLAPTCHRLGVAIAYAREGADFLIAYLANTMMPTRPSAFVDEAGHKAVYLLRFNHRSVQEPGIVDLVSFPEIYQEQPWIVKK
jgi:hypothetical protein